MSSRCFLCHALGDRRDTAEVSSVATTRSREEIERHAEVHRKQIRFMLQDEGTTKAMESGCGWMELASGENGISRNGGERRSKDPEKRTTLEDHCHAIKPKSPQIRDNRGVYCNLCKSAKYVRKGQHLYAPYAIPHAQVHVGKMTYACRHCDRRTMTSNSMRKHLKARHNIVKGNITDHFDDESDDRHLEEIKEMITKCFDSRREPSKQNAHNASTPVSIKKPRKFEESNNSNSIEVQVIERYGTMKRGTPMDVVDVSKGKDTIVAHCRFILPKRQKGCGDAFALCNLCRKKKFVYSSSGSAQIDSVLRHIQSHSDRSFYFCKLCDAQYARVDAMQKHMRESHPCMSSSNAADNHYEDKTGEFAQEIKNLITKCFGQQETLPRSVQINKKRPALVHLKSELRCRNVTKRTHSTMSKRRPPPSKDHRNGVKLGTGRSGNGNASTSSTSDHGEEDSLVHQINDQRSTELACKTSTLVGQTINCRICSKALVVERGENNFAWSAIRHVEAVHLRKNANYGCRHCTRRFVSNELVQAHLRDEHKLEKITGQYVYYAEETHEELISLFKKCFDCDFTTDSNGVNQAIITSISVSGSRTTTDDSPPASAVVTGSSSSVSIKASSSRMTPYKCQFCHSVFVYEVIYKKHMAFFHSNAC